VWYSVDLSWRVSLYSSLCTCVHCPIVGRRLLITYMEIRFWASSSNSRLFFLCSTLKDSTCCCCLLYLMLWHPFHSWCCFTEAYYNALLAFWTYVLQSSVPKCFRGY
ncbi:hypothetical protein KC19_VG108800, partial [Ceratodon purpureus]